jgi:hypothetical protein
VNRYTDGRQEGAALRPLSGIQKQKLVLMARQAFLYLVAEGELGDAAEPDVWRHEQCMQAVERPGLTACRNEDYLPLMAHFLRVQGRDEEADAALTRAEMEPRAYLVAQFNKAAQDAMEYIDDPVRYAEGFLRKACKCGIDDAPDKALWRAIYLLRNKVRCERRKHGATNQEGSAEL